MSPQKGFTKVPNDLLDELWRRKLSDNERRILLYIIRKTIGFNKVAEMAAISSIAKQLHINQRTARRCIQHLIESNILLIQEDYTFTKGRRVAINTEITEWREGRYECCHGCHQRTGVADRRREGSDDNLEGSEVSSIKRKDIKNNKINTPFKENGFLLEGECDDEDEWIDPTKMTETELAEYMEDFKNGIVSI